jgi:hypothetical protein
MADTWEVQKQNLCETLSPNEFCFSQKLYLTVSSCTQSKMIFCLWKFEFSSGVQSCWDSGFWLYLVTSSSLNLRSIQSLVFHFSESYCIMKEEVLLHRPWVVQLCQNLKLKAIKMSHPCYLSLRFLYYYE